MLLGIPLGLGDGRQPGLLRFDLSAIRDPPADPAACLGAGVADLLAHARTLDCLCNVPRRVLRDRDQCRRRSEEHRQALPAGGAINGATRWHLFWRVVLPGTLPSIFVGAAVGMGITWEVVVAAEMISTGGRGGGGGLGFFIWNSYLGGSLPQIVVGMISIGIAGYVSSSLIRALGTMCMPWRHSSKLRSQITLMSATVEMLATGRFQKPADADAADHAAGKATVELRGVRKGFGHDDEREEVVEDLSLTITPGQLTALVGPSGCGKSTHREPGRRLRASRQRRNSYRRPQNSRFQQGPHGGLSRNPRSFPGLRPGRISPSARACAATCRMRRSKLKPTAC